MAHFIFLKHLMEEAFEGREKNRLTHTVDKVIQILCLSGKTFTTLNSSKQGIGEIYRIQQTMGLLPKLTEKPKKSETEAQILRTQGNQAYKAKDLTEAMRLYTESICVAEPDGKEIAMAYANRSAVTFGLQEYQNSIDDLNRALSSDKYPKNLTPKLLERRGNCFLALSQFQKASEDFRQLILLLLHSEIDSDKVNSMKASLDLLAKCLGKDDIPMTSTACPPKLTHGPSSYIQSASAAVDIKFSTQMGRHIVATENIAPGDILAIEKPFASVVDPDCQHLYCDYCKRRCHASMPCASCINVVYCSDLCRETGWTAHHSVECDVLHILNSLGVTGSCMVALRTLMMSTKVGERLQSFVDDFLDGPDPPCNPGKAGFVDNKYISDHYLATHHLISNMEHRPPANCLGAAVIASSLVHILKEGTNFFRHSDSSIPEIRLSKPVSDLRWNHIVAGNLLMRYSMVASCNSQVTEEIRFRPAQDKLEYKPKAIGGAIYPFYSLANHSCHPDIALCPYDGDKVIMVAIKPITKGQQIFTNYRFNYPTEDLQTRRSLLRSLFFFTCKCIACTENWPTASDIPDGNPKFVSHKARRKHQREVIEGCGYLLNIFEEAEKGKMIADHLQFLSKHLTLMHECVQLPWRPYLNCQLAVIRYFHLSFNPHIMK